MGFFVAVFCKIYKDLEASLEWKPKTDLQNGLAHLMSASAIMLELLPHSLPPLCKLSGIKWKGWEEDSERLIDHLTYIQSSCWHGESEQQDHIQPLFYVVRCWRAGNNKTWEIMAPPYTCQSPSSFVICVSLSLSSSLSEALYKSSTSSSKLPSSASEDSSMLRALYWFSVPTCLVALLWGRVNFALLSSSPSLAIALLIALVFLTQRPWPRTGLKPSVSVGVPKIWFHSDQLSITPQERELTYLSTKLQS